MPYLSAHRKEQIEKGFPLESPGDLTYLLTLELIAGPEPLPSFLANTPQPDEIEFFARLQSHVDRYLGDRAWGINFAAYAEVLGSLLATALEFARRQGDDADVVRIFMLGNFTEDYYESVVAPYEDTKISENGDVYPQ